MEVNKDKQEGYVKTVETRIKNRASYFGVGIQSGLLQIILEEIKEAYDVGHGHCNEDWDAYMEDMRQEHNLSERD